MSKSAQRNSRRNSSKGSKGFGKELRILGIDDSHFEKGEAGCLIIGVLYRNNYVESVLSTRIEVDGDDATEKIAAMANNSRHPPDAIMLQGITFAGFNTVDISLLSKETGSPVISVIRKRPDLGAVRSALLNVPNSEGKWKKIESAGKLRKAGRVYYQSAGTESAAEIISSSTLRGNLPEPVRLAHVIASGIVLGSMHTRA